MEKYNFQLEERKLRKLELKAEASENYIKTLNPFSDEFDELIDKYNSVVEELKVQRSLVYRLRVENNLNAYDLQLQKSTVSENESYQKGYEAGFKVAVDRYKTRQAPARDEAKEFILEFLENGKKEVAELNEMAKVQGISPNALSRAKTELKKQQFIEYSSTGNGKNKKHYVSLKD